ncbi:MAG: menaquinone biosynthesis decarboxylase [Chloroflexi bacterium]|nr:menaquinone biosynthesis decarboxylase [Chloroflexota bacterium]
MSYRDLRDFLARLEAAGELLRISAPVSSELEITEITDRLSKQPHARNKALLFEKVEGSAFPLAINLFGTPQRMALAMGVNDLDELNQRLAKLIDLKLPRGFAAMMSRASDVMGVLRSIGLGPSMTKTAPCQEVVITENPDVNIMPILKCWPEDGGKYITLTSVITREPGTDIRNVGMYRIQVYDGQTLGLHWQRHKGGKEHQEAGKHSGETRIPVAVVLGGDPAEMWCGSAPLPPNIDEYLLAAWLRGRPVQFVKCVSQDLEVPANAEFVIEGWFDPNEHRMEGPFGDHTGFYTPPDLFPVMHVTAITHRTDPIYPTTLVGKPPMEDVWMGKATERLFLPLMKLFMGEIRDVNMPAEGVFHNLVIVSIKQRFPGHAQKIMYGLWGLGLMMLAKGLIVVDDDVDVQNLEAVAQRVLDTVDWRRDVTVVDGAVDQLDHSSLWDSYGGKIGVDATRASTDQAPFPVPPPLPAEKITALLGERWRETRQTLLVALDKTRHTPKQVMRELWKLCPDYNIIVLDSVVDLHNLSDVAWRTLGNVDWRRDMLISTGEIDHYAAAGQARGHIGIDATSKDASDGHPRGWPQEIFMAPEIVARVSRRWAEYGLGEAIAANNTESVPQG